MESKDNSLHGLQIILDRRGWGGSPSLDVQTEEQALGRLEELVGRDLEKEMTCVHSRNDSLLRAIHLQDRRLAVDFAEVSAYGMSPDEARSQLMEAYHRNNVLFDAYKQVTNDVHHFQEIPNGHYANERGWGGSPDLRVQSKEDAQKRLEGLSLVDCVSEMNSLDERNDELTRLIHLKEEGIAKYLSTAVDSLADGEIREQVKHAYHRNNILSELFDATTKGDIYLSNLFTLELLRRDGKSEEELIMRKAELDAELKKIKPI
jgi:hypothetical protein